MVLELSSMLTLVLALWLGNCSPSGRWEAKRESERLRVSVFSSRYYP